MGISKIFDRVKLRTEPLSMRKHELSISIIKKLNDPIQSSVKSIKGLNEIARRIVGAKANCAATVLMMGGHVIRAGVQRYLIDLMKRGYISCIAMNGAGMIHDFEFAMIGATTESVSCYIKNGQFGLWKETGILNDIVNQAYQKNSTVGMGYAVGRALSKGDFMYKDISILAAAHKLKIPITIHVGIGYDIIHEHPNCDGAATGALSYNDFLKFVAVVQNLEGGVAMNFGSAVMAPEVFLKALSMARNVACREGRAINKFVTLVCDLHSLPSEVDQEPSKDNPYYYFRPWKTMLARTVADGGKSYYVMGRHEDTIPSLWAAINVFEKRDIQNEDS